MARVGRAGVSAPSVRACAVQTANLPLALARDGRRQDDLLALLSLLSDRAGSVPDRIHAEIRARVAGPAGGSICPLSRPSALSLGDIRFGSSDSSGSFDRGPNRAWPVCIGRICQAPKGAGFAGNRTVTRRGGVLRGAEAQLAVIGQD